MLLCCTLRQLLWALPQLGGYNYFFSFLCLCESIHLLIVVLGDNEFVGFDTELSLVYARDIP